MLILTDFGKIETVITDAEDQSRTGMHKKLVSIAAEYSCVHEQKRNPAPPIHQKWLLYFAISLKTCSTANLRAPFLSPMQMCSGDFDGLCAIDRFPMKGGDGSSFVGSS